MDRLVATRPASDGGPQSELSERARAHLEACEACREVLSMHEEAGRLFRGLEQRTTSESTSECPERTELMELAAGTTEGKRSEELLEHLSGCDHCGPIFRQTQADFSDEKTADEEKVLAGLESGQLAWQQRMAMKLHEQAHAKPEVRPIRSSRRLLFGFRPSWAAAAVVFLVLVLSATWFVVPRSGSVDRLLAQAY